MVKVLSLIINHLFPDVSAIFKFPHLSSLSKRPAPNSQKFRFPKISITRLLSNSPPISGASDRRSIGPTTNTATRRRSITPLLNQLIVGEDPKLANHRRISGIRSAIFVVLYSRTGDLRSKSAAAPATDAHLPRRLYLLANLQLGGPIVAALNLIKERGVDTKQIKVVSAVASPPALKQLGEQFPGLHVYAGIIDPTVNDKGFILPGLGDAGDRSYGT